MKGALHKILSELHFPSLSPILWPGANFPRAFCKLEKILHFCSISSQIWAKIFDISLRKTFHHRMSTSNLRKSGAKQDMWAFRTKKGTSHTYDMTSEDKLQIHLSKAVPVMALKHQQKLWLTDTTPVFTLLFSKFVTKMKKSEFELEFEKISPAKLFNAHDLAPHNILRDLGLDCSLNIFWSLSLCHIIIYSTAYILCHE